MSLWLLCRLLRLLASVEWHVDWPAEWPDYMGGYVYE
jgi:hypothetical protein